MLRTLGKRAALDCIQCFLLMMLVTTLPITPYRMVSRVPLPVLFSLPLLLTHQYSLYEITPHEDLSPVGEDNFLGPVGETFPEAFVFDLFVQVHVAFFGAAEGPLTCDSRIRQRPPDISALTTFPKTQRGNPRMPPSCVAVQGKSEIDGAFDGKSMSGQGRRDNSRFDCNREAAVARPRGPRVGLDQDARLGR